VAIAIAEMAGGTVAEGAGGGCSVSAVVVAGVGRSEGRLAIAGVMAKRAVLLESRISWGLVIMVLVL
jgi:hypothetical protein